jgi:hypothetical protein
VRLFALTYPQLIQQGRALGYSHADLLRLRDGYDFAEIVSDGVYRPHGEPLVTHLVRTASIVAAELMPVPVVVAAMNHAAYEMHKFDESRRGDETEQHRDDVRIALGDDAEAIVWAYHKVPWYGHARDYVPRLAECDELVQRVLVIRLANALEDHLDSAVRFTKPRGKPLEANPDTVALARAMSHHQLAGELDQVYRDHEGKDPDPLARPFGRSYELPAKHLWER